jgi:autotransporter passenger strand-loop-strand repeat protein
MSGTIGSGGNLYVLSNGAASATTVAGGGYGNRFFRRHGERHDRDGQRQ